MHHPWRWLRDRLPEWDVQFAAMPPGLIGGTDTAGRTIYLAPGMLQCQRRTVLDHELAHAEAGDVGPQHPKREAEINQQSARRLIPIDQLVDAAKWAHNIDELADECWVDVATMRCRLDHLHPSERAAMKRAIAAQRNDEES